MPVQRALLEALLGGANDVNSLLWTAAFYGHTAAVHALVAAGAGSTNDSRHKIKNQIKYDFNNG